MKDWWILVGSGVSACMSVADRYHASVHNTKMPTVRGGGSYSKKQKSLRSEDYVAGEGWVRVGLFTEVTQIDR